MGQVFGELVVLKKAHKNKQENICWKCECSCGKTSVVSGGNLTSGNTKSCGNCGRFINGVLTSAQQREIANMVQGKLNYLVAGKYIDIALPNEKIAIEYDGWWWHKNKQEEDEVRKQEMLNKGWRVLTIKSSKLTPSKDALFVYLAQLRFTNDLTIVLPDWGV